MVSISPDTSLPRSHSDADTSEPERRHHQTRLQSPDRRRQDRDERRYHERELVSPQRRDYEREVTSLESGYHPRRERDRAVISPDSRVYSDNSRNRSRSREVRSPDSRLYSDISRNSRSPDSRFCPDSSRSPDSSLVTQSLRSGLRLESAVDGDEDMNGDYRISDLGLIGSQEEESKDTVDNAPNYRPLQVDNVANHRPLQPRDPVSRVSRSHSQPSRGVRMRVLHNNAAKPRQKYLVSGD